jgi:hypothetical protein
MLDRLAKTEGMCPPSSFLDMNGSVGQSVGMPEYHYTQVRRDRVTALAGSLLAYLNGCSMLVYMTERERALLKLSISVRTSLSL